MTLKPVLKSRVDDLFLFWVTESETQNALRENLRQIVLGEVLVTPSLKSIPSSHPQSPRPRPGSPTYTHKLPSPRSPRKPKNNKHHSNTQKNSAKQSVQLVFNNNQEKDCGVQERKDREKKAEKDSQQNIIITNSKIENENKTKICGLPIPKQSANIPKFYFPTGKPVPSTDNDLIIQQVAAEFSKLDYGKVHKDKMGAIAKACSLPTFWKCPLFRAAGGEQKGFITFESFTSMWKKVCDGRHDTASRFIYLLAKPDVDYLLYGDFEPLIQDIVETHPGLTFLLEAPEFHSRYVNTVISRIYFCANRSWSGKLTANELRKSNFLQTLERLEEDDDINQVTDYFSYEHFYVIYCKFWELDKDHDLYIDMKDLYRHNDHALSLRVIDRIFSGAVSRGSTFQEGKMSYTEFVWFLIAEEDKRHPRSIEYWFRCMDLDGDGVISMYEMEQFYEEQMQKMEELGIEKLPFEDCLCQMLDLVRPEVKDQVTLKDLKKCKMADIFFDTFFNLDKFLDHEQRDPFANIRDPETDGPEPSAWEKYAAEEYDILVVEEGANEHDLNEINYEDDFEGDDDDEYLDQGLIHVDDADNRKTNPRGKSSTTDDIYDFSTKNLGY
ncbi:serine/threonine-protein phosphatase 2A regulatory subunit B'' subunit beta isoform X2 [Patella vulgata]|uniref:serine/threonine-protein phosphatase 2A regulatory subunit B'' subunit beta isoform X2 n=1 Tax=Patella vulgata TaxID=6465 RepID=UPI00218056D5|nr:serine/threonine-protein phosphatase 2A regulatory subunit B'' subunit beta isoform X2 [Patella vulgata]XP_050389704.1 serine/threonine-protein phosphatase 2A regulatory subunit B'' subunit beta isoform X2 [Patella vulgata]XP_050389705.1 serine/threonine-protein phosphatase 2A regulatory subunit B'' subunit beta isoform X2 [Patella vulgata]XP_055957897.1 serine/threonine-protein phosphatase 2A regulatory subunit B'' subunit beta isoform X2 [Patella vulgata]